MIQNLFMDKSRVMVLDDYGLTRHHVSMLAKILVTSDL